MSVKNKLDKAAYIMLNIAVIITLVLVLGIIGLTIYMTIFAINDTLAGGWVFFIMGLLGIFLCPVIGGWIVQCILHLLGWIQYRKNNMIPARILGLVSSFVSVSSNLTLMVLGIMIYGSDASYLPILLTLILVPGICIVYMTIPFILLIVSLCKKNKTI